MISKKDFFRWILVILAIPTITIIVDFLLWRLLWLIDGTLFMLLWYLLLILAPVVAQFFIIRYIAPKYKNIIGVIAIFVMICCQIMIYSYANNVVIPQEYSYIMNNPG